MNWFLLLLWSYLLPGVDDDEPADEPAEDDAPADDDEPPAEDEPADEPEDDDTPPADDEPPAPRETRAQKTIRELRERTQKAEAESATARAELESARRGPATSAQPTQEQLLWQQEEETLRNPEATDWQKYAINANRAARQAQVTSQQALRNAEDMADKSAFAQLASTKPKLHAAYKDRVEAKLAELRKDGRNVPRESILKVLIGEDMLSGNLKSAAAKTPTQGAAPRARPRQDVTPNGGARLSEAEKRAKRLENVRI